MIIGMWVDMESDILFNVSTPLGFSVRTTRRYWDYVATMKHRPMYGREEAVIDVLQDPDEVRRSRDDINVFLFYRLERYGRWVCVVAKRLNGEGFLLTAYPADYIKQGELIWKK